MPTYEYECDACGHKLEELQSFNDAPLKKCPKCKKNKLERLISGGAGIIFKGDGFYETDYRKESYKEAEKKDKESSSSSTENKSDKKKSSSKKSTKKKKDK